ncbi:MAG TPA: phosphatase PAP2 family protein [Actinomycetes bacterium]|jgi:undecaprenyl-diphosphatase|nr:phosphatase PAP2 family protein [Actinomycetes bacterium]
MASPPTRGPLDPAPDDREVILAARWRRLRDGVPAALFLLGSAVVLAAVLVGVGWVLSKVVHDDGIGRADSSLSRWLAGERTHELDDVTAVTSEIGGTLTITILAVLAVAVTAWMWRRWREPMAVAVAVAGEVAIFLAVTMLVDRQRPPVGHLDEAPPTSSFPSGHTAATLVLWGALAVLASERARSAMVRRLFVGLAVALPVLVAISRLYRGMHYLSDVLGGFLLGAVWLAVTVRGIRLGVAHRRLRHGGPAGTVRSWRRSAVRHG